MENGDSSKTPTWQWLTGVLLSVLLLIAGVSLTETRSDIRDAKKANAEVCDRVTVLETANKIQFESIRQWRDEMKAGMKEIADKLDNHERNTKAMATMKKWQDYPEKR
jgi:hypothetical protein